MFFIYTTSTLVEGLVFSIVFCLFFAICFLILQATRLEECFKKGKIWQIRMTYFIISFVFSFLLTYGFHYLYGLMGN